MKQNDSKKPYFTAKSGQKSKKKIYKKCKKISKRQKMYKYTKNNEYSAIHARPPIYIIIIKRRFHRTRTKAKFVRQPWMPL